MQCLVRGCANGSIHHQNLDLPLLHATLQLQIRPQGHLDSLILLQA